MSGFTIPNTPDETVANQNQAEPDSLDFQILGRQTSGVVSGLAVSPGSGTTVNIASGEILLNGVYHSVSSVSNLALTAYATLSFFDIVYVRVTGSTATVAVQAGPQTTNPRYPQTGSGVGQINPSTDVVLAAVWRDGTAVDENRIVDKRIFVRSTTSRTGTTATGGAPADTFVNTSWTPGTNLASPFSVNVGGTWYNLAQWPSSGNFSAGTITATLNGNAATASRWATARTLTLSNNASGSASIDGSGNVTLSVSNNYAASAPWSGITGVPALVYNNGGTYIINITGNANTANNAFSLNNYSQSFWSDGSTIPVRTSTGELVATQFTASIDNVNMFSSMGTYTYLGWDSLRVRNDGSVYSTQITSGRTVLINSSGTLGTSVSTKRVKENITEYSSLSLLNVSPVKFDYKEGLLEGDDERFNHFGLIAEDLAEAGLDHLLYLDDQGIPDGVAYEKLAVELLAVVKVLANKIEALEAQ